MSRLILKAITGGLMEPETQPQETTQETVQEVLPKTTFWTRKKKLLYGALGAALVVGAGLSWYLLQGESKSDIAQFVANKKTASLKVKEEEPLTSSIDCGDNAGFADESIGMKFCYPKTWGTPSVLGAKLDPSDPGYRQVVKFSSMPYVQVGGVSDDWTTTMGRDGTCFDPSNQVPELSSYNTAWHSQEGTGADLEFAMRSLPSSVGGYALTEEVTNILQSGVCIKGYKVINAPHYRVGSLSYYRDFVEASGITTPALHVAEPNVLASTQMRQDIDALMASLVSY